MIDRINPKKIKVSELLESRYPDGKRPLSWDLRKEGVDVVLTTDGDTVRLISDGQQSPPKAGQVLMLTGGDPERGYVWTLYGLPRSEGAQSGVVAH